MFDKVVKIVALSGLVTWTVASCIVVIMRILNEISTSEMTITIIALMVYILLIKDEIR